MSGLIVGAGIGCAEAEVVKDMPNRGERVPPKQRRKPVTIDLPAAEIERESFPQKENNPASDAAPEGSPEPIAAEAATSTGPDGSDETLPSAAGPEMPVGAAPPAEPALPLREAASPRPATGHPGSDIPRPEPEYRSETPPPANVPAQPAALFVPLVVAALIGGAAVAIVVVLLARGGFFLPPTTSSPDLAPVVASLSKDVADLKSTSRQSASADDRITPIEAEVAALKRSLDALASRPPPSSGADPKALADLAGRVATLTASVEALKDAAPAMPASVTGDLAALGQKVDALSARVDERSGEARLAAIESKLDALSQAGIDAGALGQAVAAAALADAVDTGRPFTAELSVLKSLGADPAPLAVLAPHAERGLPTLAALREQFEAAIAATDLSAPAPPTSGALDRLIESARGLVAVRPAHPVAGSDPMAVVTRIRAALAAGDLKTALAERAALPLPIKDATADFAAQAEARRTADDLAAALRAAALARLGGAK